MNTSTPAQPARSVAAAVPPARAMVDHVVTANAQPETKRRGYGLPCSKCKTYYSSDLSQCPVCKSAERVSPTATMPMAAGANASADLAPDPSLVEEERERFLRDFKTQVYASHLQINAAESFRCSVEENHPNGFEAATVCQACYMRAQERADQMEAALLMDVKEATQMIYDAVWADPSDPTKTYQNAAQALLNEMRKRAGISAVLGRMQPMAH